MIHSENVRMKELRGMLGGVNASTVYRWIQKGILPEGIKITPRCVVWRRKDIEAFLDSRAAEVNS